MGFTHEYPYTDLHELNLDWIISEVKKLSTNLQEFVKLNTIKYANPILWDITSQYEANTVVINGQTGDAYLSVKPVPSGVAITTTEYWTAIFNYQSRLDEINAKIGDLSELRTEDKENVVDAINELYTYSLNTEWYDISGDYVDDLGASITNAIQNGKLNIYIPAGTYTFRTTARVNRSGVTVRGAGKDVTILKSSDSLNSCLFICDTRDRELSLSDITFRDFTIDGVKKSDAKVIKILFIAASNIAENREIINPSLINLKIVNSNGCLVNFDGGGALNRSENYWIKNAYVYKCESYNSGVKDVIGGGIHFTHSISGLVENCIVDNSGQECYTFDNYSRYMTIKNCYVGNNNGGAGALSIDLCEGFVVDGCVFDSHWCEVPDLLSRCAIKINDEGGASRGVITNCKIANNTYGIIVNNASVTDYGVEVVEISNCVIGNLTGTGSDIQSYVGTNGLVSVRNTYTLFGAPIKFTVPGNGRNIIDKGYYKICTKTVPPLIGSTILLTLFSNEGFEFAENKKSFVVPFDGLYEFNFNIYESSGTSTLFIYKGNAVANQFNFQIGTSGNTITLNLKRNDRINFKIGSGVTVAGLNIDCTYAGPYIA